MLRSAASNRYDHRVHDSITPPLPKSVGLFAGETLAGLWRPARPRNRLDTRVLPRLPKSGRGRLLYLLMFQCAPMFDMNCIISLAFEPLPDTSGSCVARTR